MVGILLTPITMKTNQILILSKGIILLLVFVKISIII